MIINKKGKCEKRRVTTIKRNKNEEDSFPLRERNKYEIRKNKLRSKSEK